jgi:predicted nucleic acid-binding protein
MAVSGQADYLVTGDKKLQALGAYRGVAIVSPAIFATTSIAQRDAPSKDGNT